MRRAARLIEDLHLKHWEVEYIPLNVGVDPLQPFVVVLPLLQKSINVDICAKSQTTLTSAHNRSQKHRLCAPDVSAFTVRSRGIFIQIKLQVVHFVF